MFECMYVGMYMYVCLYVCMHVCMYVLCIACMYGRASHQTGIQQSEFLGSEENVVHSLHACIRTAIDKEYAYEFYGMCDNTTYEAAVVLVGDFVFVGPEAAATPNVLPYAYTHKE